jgi:hypothetical protein
MPGGAGSGGGGLRWLRVPWPKAVGACCADLGTGKSIPLMDLNSSLRLGGFFLIPEILA